MKNTILLTILSLSFTVFTACGTSESSVKNTADPANTTAKNTVSANPVRKDDSLTKTDDSSTKPAASDLKPEDIEAGKPVAARDLRNAVVADEKSWMGKEVSATGLPKGSGKVTKKGQPENIYANMADEDKKWVLQCSGLAEKPETMKNNEKFVIKGKIAEVAGAVYGEDMKYVILKPCEIIK